MHYANRSAHMKTTHPGILKELSLHLTSGLDLTALSAEMVKLIELADENYSSSSQTSHSDRSIPPGAKLFTAKIRKLNADVVTQGKLLRFLSGIEKGHSFHSMYANTTYEEYFFTSQRMDCTSVMTSYEIYNIYLPLCINFLYLFILQHKDEIKTFSISVDSATDSQHRKFHAVTLRYVNSNFEVVVLNCGLYESTGVDGETLRDFYTSLLESFFLSSTATCASLVTDNAPNMVKSKKLLNSMRGIDAEDDGIGCIAHLLNLVIQDMFSGALVKGIVDRCIKCDEYLRKTGVRDDYAAIRASDGIPNVVGFSNTRFGGCIHVMRRLYDTYSHAALGLADSGLVLPPINELKTILEFSLHIVNDIDRFGAEYTITVSSIPEYVVQLYEKTVQHSKDSKIVLELKKLLKGSLDRRLLKPVFNSRS